MQLRLRVVEAYSVAWKAAVLINETALSSKAARPWLLTFTNIYLEENMVKMVVLV